MKKLLFIAAMLLMVSSASAQKKEGQTLYIVDGKVTTEQEFKAIPSGKIKNMNVMKGVKSVVVASTESTTPEMEETEMVITAFSAPKNRDAQSGSSHKEIVHHGKVLTINPQLGNVEELKGLSGTITRVYSTHSDKGSTNVTITSKSDGNKLMLNDKVPVMIVYGADGKSRKIKDISEIDASKIESMTVLKQEQAKKIYGNQYGDLKDGIIVITLRKLDANNSDETRKELKMITLRGDGQMAQAYGPSGSLFLGYRNPTILVTDADGKTAKTERVEDIKIDNIESFDVIKDEKKKAEYEKKYGPSKDGYVHIVLKKK